MTPLLTTLYVVSAVGALATATASWRRRTTAPVAGPALAVAALGTAWWALAAALVVVLGGAPQLRGAALLSITVASGVTSSGFLVLAVSIADPRWRPRRALRVLAVEPVLLVVVAATNHWHRLLIPGWEPLPAAAFVHWQAGPLFWLHTAYCYAVSGAGFAVLVRALPAAGPLQRSQIRLVLVSSALPAVAAVPSLLPWSRANVPDLSAVVVSITAALNGFAIFRLRLMRLVPLARDVVLDRMADSVFVVDAGLRLVDVNAAGRRLLADFAPDLAAPLGLPARTVLESLGIGDSLPDGELALTRGTRSAVLDVRTARVTDTTGAPIGRIVVARDVTRQHAQKVALAQANELLREQLTTIDRLRADLAELAVRDELTGLHNRRHLAVALDLAIEQARVRGDEVCLVLLDIDRFKAVNDRFGHAVGDALLVATARELAAGVRDSDTLARYGGEEFVVVLPGASQEQAFQRAEQWRRRCAALTVDTGSGPARATISAGVASTAGVGADRGALVAAADAALYAAKAAGRDRVVVAAPAPVGTAPAGPAPVGTAPAGPAPVGTEL